MERTDLLEDLKSMMDEYLDAEQKSKLAHIKEDSDFVKDINMDSIDLVDVVIKVENKYGIEIKNEDIPKMKTVRNCLDVIQEQLAAKGK